MLVNSDISPHINLALNQVKLPLHRHMIHAAASEAYADLGETDKAIYHLKRLDGKGTFYKNLLAIGHGLHKAGLTTQAREPIECAIRYWIREHSVKNVYFSGAFGELIRSYARGADALSDKGLARKVKMHARWFQSKLKDDESLTMEDSVQTAHTRLDIDNILSSAGTIYHAGFKKHGERTLNTIEAYLNSKLQIAIADDEPIWVGPGMFASLLYHQMGMTKQANKLLDATVTAAKRGIGGQASIIESCFVDDDYDDEYDEDLHYGHSMSLHEDLMRLRDLGLICHELGSEKNTKIVLEILADKISDLYNAREEDEFEDDAIASWVSDTETKALLLEARAIELELRKLSGSGTYTEILMMNDDINQILKGEHTITMPFEDRKDHIFNNNIAVGCEVAGIILAAYYSLNSVDHPLSKAALNTASDLLYASIESLDSLGHACQVAYTASALDSIQLSDRPNPENSYMKQLAEKLRTLLLTTNHSDHIEYESELHESMANDIIGTSQDPFLDLDVNRQLISDLAGFGLIDTAHQLAMTTMHDFRVLGESSESPVRTRLEAVWTDYVTGVVNAMSDQNITGSEHFRKLPSTSKDWSQLTSL